jgi:hypothetical protein
LFLDKKLPVLISLAYSAGGIRKENTGNASEIKTGSLISYY